MVWVQSAGENLKSSNQGHTGGVWFIFEYLFRPSKGQLYDVLFTHHPVVVGGLFLGQKKGGWLETRLASMKYYNLMILYELIPVVNNSVASWDLTEFEGIPKCQTTSRWLRRERSLLQSRLWRMWKRQGRRLICLVFIAISLVDTMERTIRRDLRFIARKSHRK